MQNILNTKDLSLKNLNKNLKSLNKGLKKLKFKKCSDLFDRLFVNPYVCKDKKTKKTKFYPWGIFGHGYIVSNTKDIEKIRSTLRLYDVSLLITFILSFFFIGLSESLLWMPFAFMSYYQIVKMHAKGLKDVVQPSILKRIQEYAKNLTQDVVLAASIVGPVFFLATLFLVNFGIGETVFLTLVGLPFFGGFSLLSWYMLYLKTQKK